jgi:GNAT superfamily N-acetyltransferase
MPAERLRIVPYRPDHHATVRELNVEWISRYFSVEPRDVRDLGDPDRHIIEPGGAIYVAEYDGVPVGTCSLMREPNGSYELAKMAVAESARGLGIGRALANAVIARAKEMGIAELELFTNAVLEPAVQLYRSLGFIEVPLDHSDYGRANMRMVLVLADGTGGGD